MRFSKLVSCMRGRYNHYAGCFPFIMSYFGEEYQLPGEYFYDYWISSIIVGALLPDPGFDGDGTGIYAGPDGFCRADYGRQCQR